MSSVQELSGLMMKAHADAAANNDNLSSGTIKQMAIVQKSFLESMVAGLLTLGGTHAPIEQARQVLFYTDNEDIIAHIEAGFLLPGFGNAFYKDQIDPAWVDVEAKLKADFTSYAERIEEVTQILSEAKGKTIYPNAAAFTAAVAEILQMPIGTELSLLIQGRLFVWVDQWATA